jgi:succinate dehydrogenase/fumarate reductase flavoprotein subunit
LNQETSIKGLYVAGDASGIEEASTAIIEGRIAGLAIAHSLGYLDDSAFLSARDEQLQSMVGMRSGSHGEVRAKAKEYLNTMMEEQ